MSARGLEVRVGAIVVIAAIILVVGTMWFQKFQLAEKRYHFFVRFDEVGGLVPGDPIYVNGVERGRVESIALSPHRVTVDMGVRQDVPLPDDSKVELKSVGIMGERLVAVTQGHSSRMVAPGDTLTGVFLMGMPEVMGAAGAVLADVQATARHLREVSEALSANGKLEEGVNDFAATSKNIRTLTERNRGRLERTMAHFDRSSALLDSLIAAHYSTLDSSLTAIGRAGGRAEVAVDNLAAVSGDLREITARLRAGEGSMGRLLNDDTLIRKLETTTTDLDSLIRDLQQHPGRYVKFSLF